MLVIGDQFNEEYFKRRISLAMENKISWHQFSSIVNNLLTLGQFKIFVNILLLELKKHKDQALIKIKLEPQDFYNDSIATEEQMTNESISQEQHQQISIKKEFEIDEHPISEINIQSVSSIPIQNIPMKDKSIEPTIKLETFQENISSDIIEKSKCASCNLEFDDSKSLELHQCQEIEQDQNVKCNFCEKDFPTETSLNRHVVSHYNNPTKNLKCDICDKKFRLPQNLTNHNKWIHERVKPRSQKRRKFNSYKRLKKHMLTVKKKSKITRKKNSTFASENNSKDDESVVSPLPENDNQTKRNHCEECNITFALKQTLELHIQSFHKKVEDSQQEQPSSDQKDSTEQVAKPENIKVDKKKYECKKCEKKFTKKLTLQMHVKVVHDKIKNLKCDKCSKTFGHIIHLKKHSLVHKNKQEKSPNDVPKSTEDKDTKIKKHKCEKCNKTFNRVISLNKHIMILHNKKLNKKCKKCNDCEKWFSNKPNLLRHIQKKHSMKTQENKLMENGIKCKQCVKYFPSKYRLNRHVRHVHGTVKKQKCPDCDKRFGYTSSLKYHVLKDHNKKLSEKRNFKCEQCEKSFSQNFNLTKHIRNIHAKDKKCEPGDQNEKPVVKPSNLEENAATPNDEFDEEIPDLVLPTSPEKSKNLECNQCDKSFENEIHLEKHVSIHIESPQPNPEMRVETSRLHENQALKKCKQCEEDFDTEANLSEHVVRQHFKSKEQCELCKKVFGNITNLIRHVKSVHDKIKDFKCGTCDRGFSEKIALKKHFIHVHGMKK